MEIVVLSGTSPGGCEAPSLHPHLQNGVEFWGRRREKGRLGLGGDRIGDPVRPEPGQPGKDPRSAGEPGGVDLFYNLCLMLHF